jgi:hypothetical protein
MSLLARYKKPGGFEELLTLVETSSDKTQINILATIEKEDPLLADRVKKNIFTFDELILQDERVIEELLLRIPPKMFAAAIAPYGQTEIARITQCAKLDIKRKLIDELELFASNPVPTATVSARKKILTEARKNEKDEKLITLKKLQNYPQKPLGKKFTKNENPLSTETTQNTQNEPVSISNSAQPKAYVSINANLISVNETTQTDFYFYRDNKFSLFRKKGSTISKQDIDKLRSSSQAHLFISIDDIKKYYS